MPKLAARKRRLLRCGLGVTCLIGLIAWASAPRLVLQVPSNFSPDRTIEMRALLQHERVLESNSSPNRQAANSYSKGQFAPSSKSAWPTWLQLFPDDPKWDSWYTGGFPLDAYHVQRDGHGELVAAGLPNWTVAGPLKWTWMPMALAIDVFAWVLILITGTLLAYHHVPGKSIWQQWKADRRHFGSLANWLAGGIGIWLICALSYGVGKYQEHRRLSLFGRLTQISTLPKTLRTILPIAWQAPWNHVFSFDGTFTSENGPTNPDWDPTGAPDFTKHTMLRLLHLAGDLSSDVQQQIAALPSLKSFRWQYAPDPFQVQKAIQPLSGLTALHLSFAARNTNPEKTSQNSATLNFQGLNQLQTLELFNVPQQALADLAWSHMPLSDLAIHVAGLLEDELAIEDVPALKSLRINVYTRGRSLVDEQPATITCRGLPQLSSLAIPAEQPIALNLQNIPRLTDISATTMRFRHGGLSNSEILPWLTSLRIENGASLSKLHFTTKVIDQWQISQCPRLQTLRVGPHLDRTHRFHDWRRQNRNDLEFVEQLDGESGFGPLSELTLANADAAVSLKPIWPWLKNNQTLSEITFRYWDMRKVDLSNLAGTQYLKTLSLDQCVTHSEQLESLTDCEHLTQIIAPDLIVEASTVQKLLAAHQRWESLSLDWTQLTEIEIKDQPYLQVAFGNQDLRATKLVLENLPRFRQLIILRNQVESLVLNHLPTLNGVIISGDLPPNSLLRGLQSMVQFCVIQGHLTKEQLATLRESTRLQSLCLPACVVPRDLMESLIEWPRLTTVDLRAVRIQQESGRLTPITDHVVGRIGAMPSLGQINLSHTRIGSETIRQLSQCPRLQAVSVIGCPLSKSDLEPLINVSSLVELQIDPDAEVPSPLTDLVTSYAIDDEISAFDVPHQSYHADNGRSPGNIQSRYGRQVSRVTSRFEAPFRGVHHRRMLSKNGRLDENPESTSSLPKNPSNSKSGTPTSNAHLD